MHAQNMIITNSSNL